MGSESDKQAMSPSTTDAPASDDRALLLQQALGCHQNGERTTASTLYQHILTLGPDPVALHNLGSIKLAARDITEAIRLFETAIRTAPSQGQNWLGLVNALLFQGDTARAKTLLQQAMARGLKGPPVDQLLARVAMLSAPLSPQSAASTAEKLLAQNRQEDAEILLRHLLQRHPDAGHCWKLLAALRHKAGDPQDAADAMQKAAALLPSDTETQVNLSAMHYLSGRHSEAIECASRILQQDHTNYGALYNRARSLQQLGYFEDAEENLRQASEQRPEEPAIRSELLFLLNAAPTSLLRRQENLQEARQFGELAAQLAKAPFADWRCKTRPDRLRVGLVSGDLFSHPVGYFIESLPAALRACGIDVFLYSAASPEDALTLRLKKQCKSWRVLPDSDQAAARLVHQDALHILVDLSGHTARNRLPLFAYRPAPVQASWLGYFASTGMAEIDYVIGDPWVARASFGADFTEKLLPLPDSYLCFSPPDLPAAILSGLQVQPAPALSSDWITFGCFNSLAKLNDEVLDTWASILRAADNTRLLVRAAPLRDRAQQQRLLHRFEQLGIDSSQIIAEAGSARSELLASYHRVDIALDPFPYPGGTTSAEALWMGVPVITRQGSHFLSSVGESVVRNGGLADEGIAADNDDYIRKALQMASRPDRINEIRAGLRQQVLASPLFDSRSFAHNLSALFWQIWNDYAGE